MKDTQLPREHTWTQEGIPVLTAVLSPPPAGGSAARRISRCYRLQDRVFLRCCTRWLLPQAKAAFREAADSGQPLHCCRAELSCRVTLAEGRLWSVLSTVRQTGLPGQQLTTCRGDVWDLYSGFPLPLPAFFPRHSSWRQKLPALAAEEIRRQEAAGLARYRSGWQKALRRQFSPQRFYLVPEGLVFFYPMYTLADACEGVPAFTVPWGTLGLRRPPEP